MELNIITINMAITGINMWIREIRKTGDESSRFYEDAKESIRQLKELRER